MAVPVRVRGRQDPERSSRRRRGDAVRMRDTPAGKILFVIPTLGRRNEWMRLSIGSIQHQMVDDVRVVVIGPSGSPAEAVAQDLGVDYVRFDRPGQSAAINEVWRTLGADAAYFGWLGDDELLSPVSLFAS